MTLQRFVDAQAQVMERVLAELRAGRKQSHWMWFIFPQIAGLGHSAMAQHFAIHSLKQAQAYLAHPVLGPRLRQCVEVLLGQTQNNAQEIFGDLDALKFRSCLTLFARAAPEERLFREALDKFFGAEEDPLTLEKIAPDTARS